MTDVFVWGLSGAGKDTISNYLAKDYGFLKMRIALTIKLIICEAKGISLDDLEEQKRTNPELRKMHHQVSDILDGIAGMKQSSLKRLALMIQRKSFEFEFISAAITTPIVITDARTIEEVKMMLQNGFYGIFLTRRSSEFKQAGHFTEKFIFDEEQFKGLHNIYARNIAIIDNTGDESYNNKIEYPIDFTDGSTEQLLSSVDSLIRLGLF